MFTFGLSLPEMAALKVLRSGLLAMACDPVCSAIDSIEPAPVGTCGSGNLVDVGTGTEAVGAGGSTGVGVGSA